MNAHEPVAVPVLRAPAWRREPYRLFFALGLVHAWAGVSPWFLLAVGWIDADRRVYHSIAQVQGFLMCFATGFLFTMVPRRTDTEAPSALQMVLGLIAPVGATVCAAFEWFMLSQSFWLLLVVVLLGFAPPRFRRAPPKRLPGFVWVPIALGMGVAGSGCFALFGITHQQHAWLHLLGKLLLLQGMFLGLVMGIGSMVLPLLTRGEAPGGSRPGDGVRRLGHGAAALVLLGSFAIEVAGEVRLGYAIRGLVALVLLTGVAGIHRAPQWGSANRVLVWATAWMVPLGYALAAWLPAQAQAGLHVVFLGGFAAMAFAVGAHVSAAHGGRKDLLVGWGWPVVAYGGLFAVALVARCLMVFDPVRTTLWMGFGSAAFLTGTAIWAVLAIPVLVPTKK
ncbi:MAG: NnrS family protein [Planctomycetes bacterium]|nr:NnrS family protein [Planctomycetota bacterium]MCB9871169.1 NnrS family protein [Planctomycetota bacterium]